MIKLEPTPGVYDKGSFSVPGLPIWDEKDNWYYNTKAPSDGETPFTMLKYYFFKPKDEAYGRRNVPRSPAENRIYEDTNISIEEHFYSCKYNGTIAYRVLWDKTKQNLLNHASDYMLLHGFTASGTRWFSSVRVFLDKGYRLIIPDLPAHGHSSGIHADVPHVENIPDSMFGVVLDLREKDKAAHRSEPRRLFVGGESMGGFTSAFMGVKSSMDPSLPRVDGVTAVCPMFELSRESYPGRFLIWLASFLSNKVGTLMIDGNVRENACNTEAPKLEYKHDPSTYHGRVRIRTANGCFVAMSALAPLYHNMKVPFVIIHGLADHTTNPEASQRFFDLAQTDDKRLVYLKDVEHVILRVGRTPEEDQQRQTCLSIMLDFLQKHD